VEVEVESEEELRDALRATPEWIMLDNMSPERMKACVAICARRCKLEASGGVSLETVAAIAATGVDAISIGGLTHSAPAADLSLELE
jgi:nicotinate-nucleotide pyrophosphorylase (carboxylating)